MSKTIIGVVLVLVIAGGVYWYMSRPSGGEGSQVESTETATQETSEAQTTSPTGTSTDNNSLELDAAVIDTQASGAASASASVGDSFNDQAGTQSY